ncbi:tRNA nucleotidyltransferase (CCA-adding enzyme) [Thermobacillus xylanilyticus]|jgi:tRNA nucleotidyltransferase (CCA-adding enzyme)|uniref:tRNA nucleotidyltransferase (CCA-adding enzyme) n=1 Tax=Thermobacillus xylanilyticus TaxID=76633 RepID=A0ABM8V4K5_THEXY|nr:CCA tRNA nucleotidyltransferase [Thermobacillus xylanilyticus]CAG5087061.1 tRNA nucleotidyltransferase (CCA-adding enzyme) [Thermobacillus xylanilyticus]
MDGKLKDAMPVIERLSAAGHQAYFVGGCVRDALLGRPIGDVDIATSARPEAVMAIFPKHVPTGIRHGTVTVFVKGRSYEVTTFRTESDYDDHRRPSDVAFVDDIRTDLKRRDFTVNAMAMDADGRVIDPFGGMSDLERGVIRCVGSPDERFREDALRMVRAVRFAAELGFRIAPSTWRALRRNAGLLRHIALERVGAELDKMVRGADPDRAAALFIRSCLWRTTKTPLETNGLPACAGKVKLSGLEAGDLRWIALWAASNVSPEAAHHWMSQFAFGKKRMRAIFAPLELHAAAASIPDTREAWAALALRHGRQAAADWLDVMRALPGISPVPADRLARWSAWLADIPAFAAAELALDGTELAEAAGRKGGPWIKRTMDRLLLETAAGRLPNERRALLERALRILDNEPDGKDEP